VIALPRPRAGFGRRVPVIPAFRRTATAEAVAPAPRIAAPPPETVERAQVGAFAAFHYAPFVVYFGGLMCGVTGFFMYMTAQGWLALQLTNSAAGTSLLFTVSSFPMIVLTLFGGAVADRLSRKWMVFTTRLLIAGVTIFMGVTTITGHMSIPVFVGASLVLGVVWSFDLPTRQALVSDLVPVGALGNAYAWQSVLQFTASTIGPIVAGQVALGAGPGVALVIGACGHLVLSATLLFVRSHQRPHASRESLLRRVGGGLGFIGRHEPILLLMILATISPLTIWGVMPLMPLVARDVLGGDAGTYGLLSGAIGVGSILGALFVAIAHRVRAKGWLSVLGTLISGGAFMLLAYTGDLVVALAFLLAYGATSGVASTLQQSLVQVLTPPEYQGRVASVATMTWNVQPIGVIFFGLLAESAGVPMALWTAGAVMVVTTALLTLVRPTLRNLRV
jgi:MFS family permease